MSPLPRTVIADGATKACPQCRATLVFTSHHPILIVGMMLERRGSEIGHRIRYERAWVCRNSRCDYRELVGEA
jgi:hypothetical protein